MQRTTAAGGRDSTFWTFRLRQYIFDIYNQTANSPLHSFYLWDMPVDLLAHIFMDKLSLTPAAVALEDVVEGYYHVCWEGPEEDIWATLDGAPVLVFVLDASCQLTFKGGCNQVFSRSFFCFFGLRDTYITGLQKGVRLLVVRFTSSGLYYLLEGAQMQKALCGIDEIWGWEGAELAVSVCKAWEKGQYQDVNIERKSDNSGSYTGTARTCINEHIVLLEKFLLKKLPAYTTKNYMLQSAVQLICDSRGQISVAEICTQLSLNYKWLERNFRRYLGVTPKAYLGNIRFLHAYFSLMEGGRDLIAVALDNGYYDQNHFIRDCRKYTGRVPSKITSPSLPVLPVL